MAHPLAAPATLRPMSLNLACPMALKAYPWWTYRKPPGPWNSSQSHQKVLLRSTWWLGTLGCRSATHPEAPCFRRWGRSQQIHQERWCQAGRFSSLPLCPSRTLCTRWQQDCLCLRESQLAETLARNVTALSARTATTRKLDVGNSAS